MKPQLGRSCRRSRGGPVPDVPVAYLTILAILGGNTCPTAERAAHLLAAG